MKPNGQGYGQHPNGQPTSSSYQKQQPPQPTYGNNNAHQANAPHHTAAHHMPYSQTSNAPGILPVPPQSQAHFPHHSAANNHYPNTSTTHASQAAPQSFQQTNGKSAAIIPPQPYAAPASVNTPYEQNPQTMKLRILEEENTALRNKLLEANDEKFNLQASVFAIEAEAKISIQTEVDKVQSELNFKNRELDEQSRENRKLLKELQELRQLQQQQQTSGNSGNGVSRQPSTIMPSILSPASTQVPTTSSKASSSSSSSSSSIVAVEKTSFQRHLLVDQEDTLLTRSSLKHAVVISKMNEIMERFHSLLLALNPLTSTTLHPSLLSHNYLQSPMAKVITTPSRRAAFFPMPNTRSTDHSLPLSSSLRSVLKSGSKTPHSMPIHSFDHVATLNAMSAELHQVMTQISSSNDVQASIAVISFANKVLEVARHLWDLVKFDMVVDDYNIGQTHSVGVIISPFTEALIGTLLLLRSCLELASSDDPSSHGNTSFASFASSSSSASFTRNLSSKFDTARSKNSHGSNIQTKDSNRRKQLMNKLHLPQLSPTQLNAVLDGKSIKKDKSWFDCIEDILDFLHSIMLLFHEQTHSHSQPESHSTSMTLLIQNISPSVLDLIQTLSQLQTHLATSSSSQVVVEVDSMNLPLLQSRGKYHYANLLGMIMHPSINYSQRSKSIKVLTSLLARDRNFLEFIKYQHYEGGSDHKAVSAHSKNSNKLDKFPLKSFMHYLTDELLRPVSIIAFNDNSSKDSCSNSLWESWSYKLYILQLLAAVMSQYGQITTAMLFELGSKSILEMETSTSTDPLSSSVSTMDSQGNVMNAVDEDEMDVDTDDRLHESTMSNAGDKLTRKYSRTSTTSSSTSKVADDAVVRTTSLVSTKGNGVALKRKHSTEDDPPIADWKSFNLLHFAEEADGNRSSSRISSWDRNNILRICKFWCVCWRSLDELPVGDALSDIDMCLLQCSILTTTIVNEIVGKFRSAQKQIVAHLLRGEPWSLINAFMYRYVSNGLHPVLKAAIGKDHIQHFDWLQG